MEDLLQLVVECQKKYLFLQPVVSKINNPAISNKFVRQADLFQEIMAQIRERPQLEQTVRLEGIQKQLKAIQ